MQKLDRKKVLVIALDAMEHSVVDRLMEEGRLPNLASQRSSGAWITCESSADRFVASPWPTFYTGTSPAEHGIYHYLLWDPDTMSSRRARPDHQLARPFWRDFGDRGIDTIVIDAPMVFPPPTNFAGVEITGWCTHDIMADPWVHPASVAERLHAKGHRSNALVEPYRPLSKNDVRSVCASLESATRNVERLALELLETEPWHFAMVALTSPHMAGHQFWSDTGLAFEAVNGIDREPTELLEDVYIDCDATVGRLLNTLPSDATVLVTALHGIEANRNRGDLLPAMLQMILPAADEGERKPFKILQAARSLVPRRTRQAVKSRLPRCWQDRLSGFWRTSGRDWSSTKAFALMADLQGYIRINLRGRERQGIVEPGEEYDAICGEIIAGLQQFVDADTGEPIIASAGRIDTQYPNDPGVERLPDIAVDWSQTPCATHRAIRSPYGNLDWPSPGKNFDGRSGNHRGRGFVIARGPGIEPGARQQAVDIIDLAPTLYELCRLEPPRHLAGQSAWSRFCTADN